MTEHDQRALALLKQEQLDPVSGNRACGWHRVSALFFVFCRQIAVSPRYGYPTGAAIGSTRRQTSKAVLFAILPPVRTQGFRTSQWPPRPPFFANREPRPRSRGAALWLPHWRLRSAGAGSSTPPTTACRAPRRKSKTALTATPRPRS